MVLASMMGDAVGTRHRRRAIVARGNSRTIGGPLMPIEGLDELCITCLGPLAI